MKRKGGKEPEGGSKKLTVRKWRMTTLWLPCVQSNLADCQVIESRKSVEKKKSDAD
jgi:hypothetical protein